MEGSGCLVRTGKEDGRYVKERSYQSSHLISSDLISSGLCCELHIKQEQPIVLLKAKADLKIIVKCK